MIMSSAGPLVPQNARLVLGEAAPPCTVSSFGYKYGLPSDANWVFDMRFLANPFWEPELRGLSGRDPAVRDFVLDQVEAQHFLDTMSGLLDVAWASPRFPLEKIHVALGCTGGRHRSVVMAQALYERLAAKGAKVTLHLRDVDTPDPAWTSN